MTLTLRNNPFTLYGPPFPPDNLKRNILHFLIIIPPLPTVNSLAASTNGQSINGNKADGGGDNAEENGGVMNNIMSDIQNGFVHRRLPDGGFKVFKINLKQCDFY